ncbi:MAG: 50S ribosomal protein L10 [Actinomycetota bacterium]|nr:50S ribosomal protein L10 [Actinomycetota bacterium]
MPSKEKEEKVKLLKKMFEGEDSLFFINFTGLGVSESSELRRILDDHGARMRVLKKTLTRIALKDLGREEILPFLEGPIAVIFSGDRAQEVARVTRNFMRERKGLFFRGGLFRGNVLSAAQIESLALIPPRETLVSQAVGAIRSPLFGMVFVSSAPLKRMLSVLNGVIESKGSITENSSEKETNEEETSQLEEPGD